MAKIIKKKIMRIIFIILKPFLKILLKKRIEERRKKREQEVLSFIRTNVQEAIREHGIIALDSLPE